MTEDNKDSVRSDVKLALMKRHTNVLSHWGEWSNFFESLSGRVKYGTHNGATEICTLLQQCFEEANGKRSADLSLETQQNSPEKSCGESHGWSY